MKNDAFIMMPKQLFYDEKYAHISLCAKTLYCFLLDRSALSGRNKWADKNGRRFIYFTVSDIAQTLSVGKNKAVRLLGELEENGLISRKRQGLCKPTIIYVKELGDGSDRCPESNLKNPRNEDSGIPEMKIQESPKTKSNNTDINNTDINNTDIILSGRREDDRDLSLQKIRRNIEYDVLVKNYGRKLIDSYVDIMLDAVTSRKNMLIVGGEAVPQNRVRNRLMQIEYEHIEYVIECMKETASGIRKIKNYILTALYNAPLTIDFYYEAKVREDMLQFTA